MAMRLLRGLRGDVRLCALQERRVLTADELGDVDESKVLVAAAPLVPRVRCSRLSEVAFVRQTARSMRPDVLLPLGYTTCALVAMAGIPVPIIVGVRNSPRELDGRGARSVAKRAWVRLAFRRVEGAVCISSALAEEFVGLGWVPAQRVTVVTNGVDLARLRRLVSLDCEAQEELPERFVVHVGRLSAQKDVSLLLASFFAAAWSIELDLVLVGDGPERDALEREVARHPLGSRVRFLGQMANPYPVVRRADILALSSAYEGFATVLVEALALGVPVVAVDCPSGPREILASGRFGELVEQRSREALAEGLRRALEPDRNAELRSTGPVRAEAFSLDRMLAEYDTILSSVVRNQLRRRWSRTRRHPCEPLDGVRQSF